MCQLRGAHQRLLVAARTDRAGDATRLALLAVGPQHVGDLALLGLGQPLGGALAGIGVHPHVERAVAAEAEAALGHVELRRGHAQVEQYPVQPAGGGIPPGEVGEAAAEDRHARVRPELAFGDRNRFGILVHHQQPSSGAELVEHAPRMAAAAERAVEVGSIPTHPQAFQDLPVHHGKVAGSRRALHATVRHSCRSSSSSLRSPSDTVCWICAWCACSLHSSNSSPMPSSTALRSMPTAARWLAGTVMRPLPSSSTKVAAPTSLSCRLRLTFLALGSLLTWSRTRSQIARGYR